MALITWIFVQDPLIRWRDDFRVTLDAGHKGGVRSIVVRVITAWFGLRLPGIESLAAMEPGGVRTRSSRTWWRPRRWALAAIGDLERLIAWASSGRAPRAGDQISGRICTAS